MVAKVAKVPSKPKAKAKTKLGDSKGKVIKSIKIIKPTEKDRWKGCGQKATCKSCDQSTGDLDRNAAPNEPKYLWWTRARYLETAKCQVPAGTECYECFYLRRRYFVNTDADGTTVPMSQDELVVARRQPAVDGRFWELRADRVSGAGAFKKDAVVDITALTSKRKSDYSDRFVEGVVMSIYDFAEKRRLKWETEEELVQLVVDKYPAYTVGRDTDGALIVDIPDQTGSEVRYKRGAKDSLEYSVLQKHSDRDSAKEEFEGMVDKCHDNAASRAMTPRAGSAVVPDVERLNVKAARAKSSASASICDEEEADEEDGDEDAACSVFSTHTSAAATLRMRNAVVAKVAVASVGKTTPSARSEVQGGRRSLGR
jgi:hypothetical protein